MNNRMCEMFGFEAPIFAFTHCRDVLVEVFKLGGLGVLGTSRLTPQKLREELKWIDAHIGGRPYGIDVLMPSSFENLEGEQKSDTQAMNPGEHAYLNAAADVRGMRLCRLRIHSLVWPGAVGEDAARDHRPEEPGNRKALGPSDCANWWLPTVSFRRRPGPRSSPRCCAAMPPSTSG